MSFIVVMSLGGFVVFVRGSALHGRSGTLGKRLYGLEKFCHKAAKHELADSSELSKHQL